MYVPPLVHEDLNEEIREVLRRRFGLNEALDRQYQGVIKDIMDVVWPLLRASWNTGRNEGWNAGYEAGYDAAMVAYDR